MASVYLRGNIWWGKFPRFVGDSTFEKWQWKAISTRVRLREGENPANKRCPSRLKALQKINRLEAREMAKFEALTEGFIDDSRLRAESSGPICVRRAATDFLRTIDSSAQQREADGVLSSFIEAKNIQTVAEFGSKGIKATLRDFLDDAIDAGRTREWVLKQRAHVVRFGDWLEERDLILSNFARQVRVSKGSEANHKRKVAHRAFRPEEARLMLEDHRNLFTIASGEQPIPEIRRLFYRTCFWTGLRGEEAMRLTRADVDLSTAEAAVLHVRREISKNNLDCYLPVAPSLARALTDRFGMAHPRTQLFAGLPARKERRKDLLLDDLMAVGVSIAGINWRSFRMSFVSWMEAAGVELGARMKLRRDRGRGSERLTNWTYSDWQLALPMLRDALVRTERWFDRQAASAEQAVQGAG